MMVDLKHLDVGKYKKNNGAWAFFTYYIQHCVICRPSDSTVPKDAVCIGSQTL